ncbi:MULTISPECIES: DUF6884 domain-containing protein [unclassified Streptomyces]|uniref:DUF6884 domain-containing protein n=1 Tax=unclassified Streptomyces TaxID=2593676 RepID=UPI002255A199|nr:DUF6884 domain-containing protein [Streptomyces sp. NBC_01264]MCX4784041.1 hypothetical protein [Streptomyces sp. NBC_01264]
MTGPPAGEPQAVELSWAQRAGLHSAAVHPAGDVPASLADSELYGLERLGLIGEIGPRLRRLGPHTRAAQFRINAAGRTRVLGEALPRVVVVPCSNTKSAAPAGAAGEMYIGSYHRAARRAAETQAGPDSQLLVLSAKFGLLRPQDHILRYDLRAGQRGQVPRAVLLSQAHHLAVGVADVTVFAGKAYANLARTVWPALAHPLAGARGIGDHLAFFADLYAPDRRGGAPDGPGLCPQGQGRTISHITPTAAHRP